VGSNFSGALPPTVIRSQSKLAIAGYGQNTINPRVGFAYQLPDAGRIVLRGGYGVFHETPTGQPNLQLLTNPPYSQLRQLAGGSNGAATFAAPFAPFTSTFPSFSTYSPSTALSLYTYAYNFRPAIVQHFSLGTQTQLARNTALEVGYLGTRGQHLLINDHPNQAPAATAAAPVNGARTTTLANVRQRLPLQGFGTSTFTQVESSGSSWYHGMLVNFTQRFKGGSEAQVAYTWSKGLSDSVGASTGANGGARTGDQTNPRADYGPDLFSRRHRLVANFLYEIPTPFRPSSFLGETLGGWGATGVITIQVGRNLTITKTDASNAFGVNGGNEDFAQIAPGCTNSQLATVGSATSRLKNYFNKSCFTAPPVVGTDGIATGFGNSKPGIVRGPAQNNLDFALQKRFSAKLFGDTAHGEFRTELFNAFNTPQFSEPNTNFNTAQFGLITTTAVAPRIMQLAVKLSF